jgi:hypothetical protein
MMGRHEVVEVEMPDTFGLQEFFITDTMTEIDGPNVRVLCGARRGGQVHWLYSCVMRWDRLAEASRQLAASAMDAQGMTEVMAGRGH